MRECEIGFIEETSLESAVWLNVIICPGSLLMGLKDTSYCV